MTTLLQSAGSMRRLGGAALALLAITWGFYEWTWRGKSAVFERTYVVGFRVDPPFTIKQPGGTLTGLVPEVLRRAGARKGIRLRFVASGKDDGAEIWPDSLESPAVQSGRAVLEPWHGLPLSLVSRADQYATEVADLARRKVSVPSGGVWKAIPRSMRPAGVRLQEAANRREALVNLCAGNVDAAVIEQPFLEQLLLDRPDECSKTKLKTAVITGAEREMRIVAAKNAQPVAEMLQEEIRAMISDGTFARVTEPFGASSSRSLKLASRSGTGSQELLLGFTGAGLIGALVFLIFRRRSESPEPLESVTSSRVGLSLALDQPQPEAALELKKQLEETPPPVREETVQLGTEVASPAPHEAIADRELQPPSSHPRFIALGCELHRTLQQAIDLANLNTATKGGRVHLDLERSLPAKVDCSAAVLKEEVADAISKAQESSRGHDIRVHARRGSGQVAVEVEVGVEVSNQPMQELRQLLASTLGEQSAPGVEIRLLIPDFFAETEPEPQKEQTRVLLVEDNPLHRGSAKRLLMEMGCYTEVAPDGNSALEILRHQQFDLIFVDYLMPGIDGPETVRRYRRTENGSRTPVVMLLTGANREQEWDLVDAGADAYLEKPLSSENLSRVVTAWAARM